MKRDGHVVSYLCFFHSGIIDQIAKATDRHCHPHESLRSLQLTQRYLYSRDCWAAGCPILFSRVLLERCEGCHAMASSLGGSMSSDGTQMAGNRVLQNVGCTSLLASQL